MSEIEKSHYAVLGISSDSSTTLIKAAFRALAKQYHPDTRNGGDSVSTEQFTLIHDAYRVLSNSKSRIAYDKRLGLHESEELPPGGNEDQEAQIDPDEVWNEAERKFPEINRIHVQLCLLSIALANRFRLAILNNKYGDSPGAFAARLEREFFKKYFGNIVSVQALAKRLLLSGHKLAAKDLNKAVKSGMLQDKDRRKRHLEKIASEFPEKPKPATASATESNDEKLKKHASDKFSKKPAHDNSNPLDFNKRNSGTRSFWTTAAIAIVMVFSLAGLWSFYFQVEAGSVAPRQAGAVPEVKKQILDRIVDDANTGIDQSVAEADTLQNDSQLVPQTIEATNPASGTEIMLPLPVPPPPDDPLELTTRSQQKTLGEPTIPIVSKRLLNGTTSYPEIVADDLPYGEESKLVRETGSNEISTKTDTTIIVKSSSSDVTDELPKSKGNEQLAVVQTLSPSSPIDSSARAALCNEALIGSAVSDPIRNGWETSPKFRDSVSKAKVLGLTVSDCQVAVGLMPVGVNIEYAIKSDGEICRLALDSQRLSWEKRKYFEGYVSEAMRRSFDQTSCRIILVANQEAKPATGGESVSFEPAAVIPRPRAKPLEILMQAASNMKIVPVAPTTNGKADIFPLSEDVPAKQPLPGQVVLSPEFFNPELGYFVPQVSAVPTLVRNVSLADLSERELCRGALNLFRLDWESKVNWSHYVAEAKRRSLDVIYCRNVLNSIPPLVESRMIGLSDVTVCSVALDKSRLYWDRRESFLQYVFEAKRRSFDEVACRSVLNTAVQQLPTKAITDRLPNGMQQESEWSNANVCSVALLTDRTNWSVATNSRGVIFEAKKRGLGVNDCRVALGLKRLPDAATTPSLTSYDNQVICLMALDLAKKAQTNWQGAPTSSTYVSEAKRRGFDIETCRVMLGL